MKGQRRRAKLERRERRRAAEQGRARAHWNRRRRGSANSAPELRHRPSTKGIENELIGGGVQRWGATTVGHRGLRGLVGSGR